MFYALLFNNCLILFFVMFTVLSKFNVVHGDIQPGNMLMGRGMHNQTVHLIDFGLCTLTSVEDKDNKMFRGAFARDIQNNDIEDSTINLGLVLRGTLTFASRGVMQQQPLSSKDDIESLSYSLAYLLGNSLPWTKEGEEGESECDLKLINKVLTLKMQCTPETLCNNNISQTNAGQFVSKLYKYSLSLKPTDKPDYEFLINLVQHALLEEQLKGNKEIDFDWIKEKINWCNPDGKIVNEQY